jgi:ubiquinone/menaquinone biosynthesis C-methylase UbiE
MNKIEQESVKNIYEIIATQFSNKRYETWDWINKFIFFFPINSTILDLGCGNGRNMMNNNYNFIGIDNCNNLINIAINKNLNVILSDMTKLPFNNNTFDAIISIASFHHLSNISRRKECLSEMKRVLNNGKILLSVWSIDQSHNKKLKNQFIYGDNLVPFCDNKGNVLGNRYYYIFELNEIISLLSEFFIIESHYWIHGNEVFILY